MLSGESGSQGRAPALPARTGDGRRTLLRVRSERRRQAVLAIVGVLLVWAPAAEARTRIARTGEEPALAGAQVVWGKTTPGRGLDVWARAPRGRRQPVWHEPQHALPRRHYDYLSFAASSTHLVVLHDDTAFYGYGKDADGHTVALELRGAPFGSPPRTILRCEPEDSGYADWERLSFAVAGRTVAYGPAPCPDSDPASIAVHDVETGQLLTALVQPSGTTAITDLRLVERYVAWVRHFGLPGFSDTITELVVADLASGIEVLRLRERSEIPSAPKGLALQDDGKVAFVVDTPGRADSGDPGRLAWASPVDALVHVLPIGPGYFYQLAIAGDRIAFVQNLDDACGTNRGDRHAVALSDLAGRVSIVGPAGEYGRLTPAGFDGRRITWLRYPLWPRPRTLGGIYFQDLEHHRPRPQRRPPPCG